MSFTPHSAEDRRRILERIGVASVDELFSGIPPAIRLGRPLALPDPLSETEALAALRARAARNPGGERLACFAGAGAYDHTSPAIVDAVISRSEFYTAYTPYQAEVSQGTLQSIYEFQSLACRLTGMEVANASMYDAGSALAEAVHMARGITRRERVLVSESVHPAHLEVIRTYAHGLGIPVETVGLRDGVTDPDRLRAGLDDRAAAVVVQHPNFFGSVEPMPELAGLAHAAGALFIAAVDPVSLGALAPPGSYGADIAVAEGQALGLPLSFGGPYLGILATKLQHVRHLPGRIVGRTADLDGRTGYVLALQTREQHIRRERAASNICTNQALMALAATVWLAWFGREGIRELARQCLSRARYLAGRIAGVPGFAIANARPFFKEFAVVTPVPAAEVVARGLDHGLLAGVDLGRFNPGWRHRLLVAVTENRSRAEIDRYADFLAAEFGGRG
jgi:glycine dehydrogenase subunit 1